MRGPAAVLLVVAAFVMIFAVLIDAGLTGRREAKERQLTDVGGGWHRWEDPESPVVCYRKRDIGSVSCVLVPYELRPAKEQP
jgi:hypothetical protein